MIGLCHRDLGVMWHVGFFVMRVLHIVCGVKLYFGMGLHEWFMSVGMSECDMLHAWHA
jgi:hypothetical protein